MLGASVAGAIHRVGELNTETRQPDRGERQARRWRRASQQI